MSRKIDALVAEHVMGLYRVRKMRSKGVLLHNPNDRDSHPQIVPFYSTCIKAAWEVVEKMPEFYIRLHRLLDGYRCEWYWINRDLHGFRRDADTAPMAICLAALKAKGMEVD